MLKDAHTSPAALVLVVPLPLGAGLGAQVPAQLLEVAVHAAVPDIGYCKSGS